MHLGRFEEAIAEAVCAVELDPLAYNLSGAVAWVYMFARQNDRLLSHAKRSVELHPDVPLSHWALPIWKRATMNRRLLRRAWRRGSQERRFFARCWRRHVLWLVGGTRHRRSCSIYGPAQVRSTLTPYMFARIHTALGNRDEAFRWLNIAYQQRAPWMVLLKRDPRMDSLRADPRYESLVRLMNFPS